MPVFRQKIEIDIDPPSVPDSEDAALTPDPIEEKLPLGRSGLLGAQQVLVSNTWLDPILIAGVAGLTTALATNLVTATFLAAGVATFIQTLKLVRLPILEGPSSAFSPLAIMYAKSGTLAAASTGLLIGAALAFVLAVTGLLAKVRTIFTPAVTGTVITLVGLALAGFTFMLFFGMPGSGDFASGPVLLIASVTTAVVIVGGAVGGKFRMFCFLIALVVGDLLALAFGLLDFSPVSAAPWLAVPMFLPYGALHFDLAITITMTIVFFVAVIEAIGMYEATALVTKTKLTSRRISFGVAGEAGGSILSALLGGFGTTAYAQNLGVVKMTGIASRYVMRVAAVILIVLAFMPKVATILVATPAPVIGGLFLPAAATVVMTGLQMVVNDRGSQTHNLVGPLGIMAGLGIPLIATDLQQHVPTVIGDFLPHQIIVGTVAVLFFEIVLVKIPDVLSKNRTKSKSVADPSQRELSETHAS